jgi:hypothetical protein
MYVSSFAGGAMAHVQGILAALYERSRSGRGQVVDTALVDGAALVATLDALWRRVPGNVTVTDAPHYTVYECADGRHMAVAALEPHLYGQLLEELGLDGDPRQLGRDPSGDLERGVGAGVLGDRDPEGVGELLGEVRVQPAQARLEVGLLVVHGDDDVDDRERRPGRCGALRGTGG